MYIFAGADKEKTDQCGFNALHHAASNGHLLVVKVLVEAGNAPSTNGFPYLLDCTIPRCLLYTHQ